MSATMKTLAFLFLSAANPVFFTQPAFCQAKINYSYLVSCFKNSPADTSEIEIDKIGNVKAISLSSRDMEETGLTYYDIPENKKNKTAAKLAEYAAGNHIQTWKNNSRIVLNKKYKDGNTLIIDLRLHILIENIYMQVICISEEGKMYEIMCFRDTAGKDHFDGLMQKVREKKCWQ